jgi:septal ring factor EnvC (AmiA/AmiB activator)
LPHLLALLLFIAHTGPALAQAATGREDATRRQVEDSERVRAMQVDAQRLATEQAAQALAEEQRLTAEQSAAFERLKRAEVAVNEMTKHMLDLNQRRADAQSRIEKRLAALRPMLPLVVRMSDYPVETLLGAQRSAEDAVRGILVLRGIARQAETDARSLIEDREALDAATKAAAEVAPQLAAAEAARSLEADALAHQLAETRERRESAEQDAAAAARRAAAEAARANSLRSMLQILETQRRLEEARAREDELRAEREQKETAAEAARARQAALTRPTGAGTLAANAKPSGQMMQPAAGSLMRGWGDPDGGEPATGQSWQTDLGAGVIAPCGGTVAFAEPFRGYGLLVIIDCGGGYHAVLAGLDQISVVPGRTVSAGEPVGMMQTTIGPTTTGQSAFGQTPGRQAATGQTMIGQTPVDQAVTGQTPPGQAARQATTAASGVAPGAASVTLPGTSPVLYFELRKSGRPVNPAPWLKPSGP